VDLVHSSRRLLLSGEATPGFAVLNATLRLPRVAGTLDVSLSGYNLLDARYSDPASAEHLQGAIPRPRRSFLFRIGGRF
jgi:iron complex outermembrane receptor protein